MTREDVAKIAHEANRAYCETLGDHSQVPWESAPQWQKDSALTGVNLHVDNPDAGPEASHISWYNEKQKDGWVWGPVKNPDKKEHPCMMPFNQLPLDQQLKDRLFRHVVMAFRNTVMY
jgi:hypothetical protein